MGEGHEKEVRSKDEELREVEKIEEVERGFNNFWIENETLISSVNR